MLSNDKKNTEATNEALESKELTVENLEKVTGGSTQKNAPKPKNADDGTLLPEI